ACGPAALECLDPRGLGSSLLGGKLVLARRGLQLLQFQLELAQQPRLALGALAIELAPELLDLQFQAYDQCLGARRLRRQLRDLRLGRVCTSLFGGQSCLQLSNRGGAVLHAWSLAETGSGFRRNLRLLGDYPASAGA